MTVPIWDLAKWQYEQENKWTFNCLLFLFKSRKCVLVSVTQIPFATSAAKHSFMHADCPQILGFRLNGPMGG